MDRLIYWLYTSGMFISAISYVNNYAVMNVNMLLRI